MSIVIVRLYHDLLGTYGDQGNAEVLIHRARGRGISSELLEVHPGDQVPTSGNIYLIGGGEDGPQALALEMLRESGNLQIAVNHGSTVLAVCAGFQLIGNSLPNAQGHTVAGLGLIDADTVFSDEPRCVGEVASVRNVNGREIYYTGFENHQGRTVLGDNVQPLGMITAGMGNGIPQANGHMSEGAVVGKVYGTYLHGPVLARNPHLADELLESVTGPLASFDDSFAHEFASERLEAIRTAF